MTGPDCQPVTSEVAGPSTVLCFQVLPSLLRPPSHPAAWLCKSSFRENSLSQIPTPGTQVGACSFLDARAMTYSPNGWAFGWADSASPIGGSATKPIFSRIQTTQGLWLVFDRLVDTQAIRCDSLQLQRWPTRIEPGFPPPRVSCKLQKSKSQEPLPSQESQAVCTNSVHALRLGTRSI